MGLVRNDNVKSRMKDVSHARGAEDEERVEEPERSVRAKDVKGLAVAEFGKELEGNRTGVTTARPAKPNAAKCYASTAEESSEGITHNCILPEDTDRPSGEPESAARALLHFLSRGARDHITHSRLPRLISELSVRPYQNENNRHTHFPNISAEVHTWTSLQILSKDPISTRTP